MQMLNAILSFVRGISFTMYRSNYWANPLEAKEHNTDISEMNVCTHTHTAPNTCTRLSRTHTHTHSFSAERELHIPWRTAALSVIECLMTVMCLLPGPWPLTWSLSVSLSLSLSTGMFPPPPLAQSIQWVWLLLLLFVCLQLKLRMSDEMKILLNTLICTKKWFNAFYAY